MAPDSFTQTVSGYSHGTFPTMDPFRPWNHCRCRFFQFGGTWPYSRSYCLSVSEQKFMEVKTHDQKS